VTQLENQLKSRDEQWMQHHKENCVYLISLETEKQQVRELREMLQQRDTVIKKQEEALKNGHAHLDDSLLFTKNQDIQKLQSEIQHLKQHTPKPPDPELLDLREKLSAYEEKERQLNTQLKNLTQSKKILEATLARQNETNEYETNQLRDKLTVADEKANLVNSLTVQVANLKKANETLESALAQEKAKVGMKSEKGSENGGTIEHVKKLETHVKSLESHVRELTSQNEGLQKEKTTNNKLTEGNKLLQEKITKLESKKYEIRIRKCKIRIRKYKIKF